MRSRKAEKSLEQDRTPHGRYRRLKVKAKMRGLSVTLSLAQYRALIAEGTSCYYCGSEDSGTSGGSMLDRLNPKYGYSKKNVVRCCWECNRLRGAVYSVPQMKLLGKVAASLRKDADKRLGPLDAELERLRQELTLSMKLMSSPMFIIPESSGFTYAGLK